MNRQVNLILFCIVAARIERESAREREKTGQDKRGQRRDKSIERENQILLLSTDRMNRSIFHISLLLSLSLSLLLLEVRETILFKQALLAFSIQIRT